ncbi:MAG: 6-carboxytetrahydropterin synthase [Deltaproteobacteria bacterium]|nr:6-carboxytetrahydropterin synthase [Deltaproteobacteria bacterium]
MKVKVDGWRSHIIFSSAHFIPDYERCGRLHGHSYAIHATVDGEMDEMGIVVDFGELKRAMKKIADELDHHMLIPEKGNLEISVNNGEVEVVFDRKRYVFPEEDCKLLPISSSSAESLALYVLERLIDEIKMPRNIKSVEIGVDEGFGQGAWISKKLR